MEKTKLNNIKTGQLNLQPKEWRNSNVGILLHVGSVGNEGNVSSFWSSYSTKIDNNLCVLKRDNNLCIVKREECSLGLEI